MNAPEETTQGQRDLGNVAARTDEEASRAAAKTMGLLKRKPTLGVMLASGLGFIAASVIGVGEVAVAMAAGYVAYRALHT